MNQDIKFTIIIPTRDRADVLKYSLASATSQDYENLEIIVSDNASVDNTYEVVSQAQANDPRIKYINTGERLSMSHNWEFALNHVTDGWVTILGDDDAILPGALQKVNNIVQDTHTQAVRSGGCSFHWPSFLRSNFGKLSVDLRKGYKRFDSKKQLRKVMEGKITYNYLPMLYTHGFVDVMLIEKAKKISNNFYLSMTPDVYSAIVLSLLTDNYVYSFEPFAIDAHSKHSNGASHFYNSDIKNDYSPSGKFFSENNIPFHKELPLMDNGRPPKSFETIVYEAYLQASPFIQEVEPYANHEKQLEIILRKSFLSSSDYKKDIVAWGGEFANLHSLDFPKILSKSSRFLAMFRIKYVVKAFYFWLSIYPVFGTLDLPLKNVFEASIVAGTIKQLSPNNILYRLRYLFVKSIGYLNSQKNG
jgi:glycosyltransferase involved in cell wall biosynthesis